MSRAESVRMPMSLMLPTESTDKKDAGTANREPL
jgi:hypothetical protein